MVYVGNPNSALVLRQEQRSSNKAKTDLSSPIILYTGHQSEIFCLKFSPDGSFFASAGFDRQILLWNTFDQHNNFAVLTGHLGAILDLNFDSEGDLVTSSSDKFICLWDMGTGARLRKFRGHTSYVNSCACNRRGPRTICSGSDDSSVKIWDARNKNEAKNFDSAYPVCAVEYSDTAEYVFSGGIDNIIKVWDVRKGAVIFALAGHTDTITGLRLSPDGNFLLSNSMDNTVRMWDVRPYAPRERCYRIFFGAQANYEQNLLRCSWSPILRAGQKQRISAGSADRFVYIWDVSSGKIMYKLPGHTGSVNETAFHPTQDIIGSCSSDKKIFLGEI